MRIVPRRRTSLPVAEAARYAASALSRAGLFTPDVLLGVLTLYAWESGHGALIDNFNPGNITASDAWPNDAFRPAWYTVDESSSARLKELHEQMLQHQAPSAFRAYDDWDGGFDDLVHNLRDIFPEVLEAMRIGTGAALAAGLGQKYSKGYAAIGDELQSVMDRYRALADSTVPEGGAPKRRPFGSSLRRASYWLEALQSGLLSIGVALIGLWALDVEPKYLNANEVRLVQAALNQLGFELAVDGVWGPVTQAAIYAAREDLS